MCLVLTSFNVDRGVGEDSTEWIALELCDSLWIAICFVDLRNSQFA